MEGRDYVCVYMVGVSAYTSPNKGKGCVVRTSVKSQTEPVEPGDIVFRIPEPPNLYKECQNVRPFR